MNLASPSFKARRFAIGLAACLIGIPAIAFDGPEPCPPLDATHRYLTVPLVYARPELGSFRLYYETNTDFNPAKRTVFFLHDGQQQPTAVGAPDELKKKYGLDLNIVRMEHRGLPCSRIGRIYARDGIDWELAYQVFSSVNVVEDIDRIRIDLVGQDRKIYLWGRSGGGFLAAQYLATHASSVDRAAILVSSDNSQTCFLAQREQFFGMLRAEGLMEAYLDILAKPPVPDIEFLWILQRLGYDHFPSEKKQADFIRSLRADDLSLYRAYLDRYKNVDEFMAMIQKETPFSTVRIHELFFHGLEMRSPKDPTYGLLEPNARPLKGLMESGRLRPGIIDVRSALAKIETEVLLVPARWDNITPPTEMAAMNKNMRHSRLVVLDDLHNTIKSDAFLSRLLKAFYENGALSAAVDRVLASDPADVWTGPLTHSEENAHAR
jgi:pimeloyl-ACP methyl ester carboxylesterase